MLILNMELQAHPNDQHKAKYKALNINSLGERGRGLGIKRVLMKGNKCDLWP